VTTRSVPLPRRRPATLVKLALLVALPGCVYFNGIYNAQEAAARGDARLRRGAEAEATGFFQQSAATAESVLVRHPDSKWRPRALYLAGRGAAFGSQCERAVPRLAEFLALPGITRADADRARLALGACDLQSAQVRQARARIDSVIDARDPETARQARLWATRAALAARDRDAAERYLAGLDGTLLQWELLSASLAARDYARAESLLVQRATRGDYRDDVIGALRELWAAGRWDGVEEIVRRYDGTRLRDASRVAMHYAVGDLQLRAGLDSLARQHLFIARGLAGRDTTIEREAAARLALLALPRVTAVRDIDSLFAQQDSAVRRTQYARLVADRLLLLKLLVEQEDATGAALFLGAEVARDSLRARELARTLFLQVARDLPGSPLVANAWHAAARLTPDSADEWRARILRDHQQSYVAAWLSGQDPAQRPDFITTPQLLSFTWERTTRQWADSVRKLRQPPRSAGPVRP
jgi:hypothetical protein